MAYRAYWPVCASAMCVGLHRMPVYPSISVHAAVCWISTLLCKRICNRASLLQMHKWLTLAIDQGLLCLYKTC